MMKRKRFIKVSLGAAATLLIPSVYSACRHRITHNPVLRPEVLAHFCDEEAIRTIGRSYLASLPADEGRQQILEQKILAGYSGPASAQADQKMLADWIGKKVEEDFRQDRTVVIDGWVLSETEAGQCALLSLT